MRRLFVFFLVLLASANLEGDAKPEWKSLAPGLEITSLTAVQPAQMGDSKITVLRIDPNKWDLEFAGISQTGVGNSRSAREWCSRTAYSLHREASGRT